MFLLIFHDLDLQGQGYFKVKSQIHITFSDVSWLSQGGTASNLVDKYVQYRKVFLSTFRDIELEVKDTARSKLKFTLSAIPQSGFNLQLKVKKR